MKKSALIALGALVISGGVLTLTSSAEARRGADDVNEHAAISTVGVAISQAKAIEIAQSKLAGTVKKAQLELEHGKKTWQVRILAADGKRGDFRIDAQSGEVLRSKIKATSDGDRSAKLMTKAEKKRLKMEAKQKKFEEKIRLKAEKRAWKSQR